NIKNSIETLLKKYPEQKERIETGVAQCAALWTEKDGNPGDFENFCRNNFLVDNELETLFKRFEEKLEYINGHFTALMLQLRHETDENTGPLHPIDTMFASYSPAAHFMDDMFQTKLAFSALLNFKTKELDEILEKGAEWSRDEWAKTRLGRQFSHRVPSAVNQELMKAYNKAEIYISGYNICMDSVVDENGKAMFRKDLKLISHWGLRDELRVLYSNPKENLKKQMTILQIMERIISQKLPWEFINNGKKKYEPFTNTLDGKNVESENNARYQYVLDIFNAHRKEDAYYPKTPSHARRKFELTREIPEKEVEKLFTTLLSSEESKEAAAFIKSKLNRDLKPFDIWYDGFKSRSTTPIEELDKKVREKYPNLEAFENDMANILRKLGFKSETADFVASKIEVDPARGAGHAWGPGMRGEKSHLRTRVPASGMDYQGFNTAMHELGHCTEQTFSIYKIDHTLLEGVPNTAFTEGFAFVFQDRDMEVLDLSVKDENSEAMKALDTFWMAREIAGVALVDMRMWRWLYENKDANADELKNAVVSIAKDVWNSYFADVFGFKDSSILAIYSHMISSGMYLPDYPLGYIIAYQVEEYFKTHDLAGEMERMCKLGSISPAQWMREAVGEDISTEPLIKAAGKALKHIGTSSLR
ncbi:MAG: hypothetical protein U9Q34_05830, partial [Elusimicrobiota bacterium]|nr:hypothetical protein [Elusimicrobiota bacterium]